MADLDPVLERNLATVRERIAAAALRGGRQQQDVLLVAVTKYAAVPLIRQLAALGCRDLGESRPQDLWAKASALPAELRWRLIGHLQRNKARRTLPLISALDSLDSVRLATAVNEELRALGRRLPTLLEVNISGDAAKHGFLPAEMEQALADVAPLAQLEIQGLMAMAGREGDEDSARRDFSALRELRDRLRPLAPPGVRLDQLSMGMSGDFEIAIEEGATIIRVGSALFEGLAEY